MADLGRQAPPRDQELWSHHRVRVRVPSSRTFPIISPGRPTILCCICTIRNIGSSASYPKRGVSSGGALELRPRMPMGCRPELDPAVVGSDHALQRVRSIELHQYATGGNLVTPGTVLFCVFVRLGFFFGCALTRLSFFLPPCFVPFSLCLFLFFIDAVLPLFRVLVPIMSDCLTYHILSKGIVINSWCWLQLVRGLTKSQKRVL